MNKLARQKMMNEPYIREVILELQKLGYIEEKAKEVLVRHYRVCRRSMGFDPNPWEFAREVDELNKGLQIKYDPKNPNQIYIGDLRGRIKRKLRSR